MGSKNNGRKRIFLIAFLIIVVSSCGGNEDEDIYPDINMLGKWTGNYNGKFSNGIGGEFKNIDIEINAVDENVFTGVWKYASETDWPSGHLVYGYYHSIYYALNGYNQIHIRIYTQATTHCSFSSIPDFSVVDEEYEFQAPIKNFFNFTDSRTEYSKGCFGGSSGEMTISRNS